MDTSTCDQLWHSTFLLYKSIALLSPKIFLHRSLRYRKHFSNFSSAVVNRSNKRSFSPCSSGTESPKRPKLDQSLCNTTPQKRLHNCEVESFSDLQIVLNGVIDEKCQYGEVEAEAIVVKINGSTLNESGSYDEASTKLIGNFKFNCQNNSKSPNSCAPVVFTVPRESFYPVNGHTAWTSWLMLKCTIHPAKSQDRLLRLFGHRQSSEWRPSPNIVRTAILPLSSNGESCLTTGPVELKFWKTGKTGDQLMDNLKYVFPLGQNAGLSPCKTNGKLDTDSTLWLKVEVSWIKNDVYANSAVTLSSSATCESSNSVKTRRKGSPTVGVQNGVHMTPPQKSPCSSKSSCWGSPFSTTFKSAVSLVPSNLEYRFVRSSSAGDRNGSQIQLLKLDSKPDTTSRCPMCQSWCEDLYSLLKHLRTCHFRFAFIYKNFGDKHVIEVKLNRTSDQHKDDQVASRSSETKRRLESIAFFRKKTNPNMFYDPDRNLEEFHYPASLTTLLSKVSCTIKPKRQSDPLKRLFFCGETCVPLTKEEVHKNEQETFAPEWICTIRKKLIDEFSDVNLAEKEIMKAWNEHILKNNYFGDDRMFSICQKFWQNYGETILSNNWKANYSLHLANLCNDGVLSQKEFYNLMLTLKSDIQGKSKK